MSVASVFEFRFSATTAEEGHQVATAIGADMSATAGYLDHEVIRDVADPGHVVVLTRWGAQADGEAVLSKYIHDPKIGRATELAGAAPRGFLGAVTTHDVR